MMPTRDDDLHFSFLPNPELTPRQRARLAADPENDMDPESYEDCVADWLKQDVWTPLETASLLNYFRADRPLEIGTPQHDAWDDQIRYTMGLVVDSLGYDLPAVGMQTDQWPHHRSYSCVYSPVVVDWARTKEGVFLPEPLERLGRSIRITRPTAGGDLEIGSMSIPTADREERPGAPFTLSELEALATHSTQGVRMLLWAIRQVREVDPPGDLDTQTMIAKYIEEFAPEPLSGRAASAIKDLISTDQAKAGGPKAIQENLVRGYHYRNLLSGR